MSDTILGGDFTVYYEADNRQKRIEWTGTATGTRTVNELYSALQDLFDELTQLDDGTPMSAQTPTEYTIGIIDTGDDDPWFIDNTTVEHLTGGAIQTSSWTLDAATDTNTGIVRITYTDTTGFSPSDIGKTVTNDTGSDTGTLLDYNDSGATNYAWIRPTTTGIADDWDSTTGNLSVTGGTATAGAQATAAVTGEDLWANINTIGTIASNTHIYVEQNGALLTAAKASTDWWSDGQIDILIKVREAGTEIDEGVVGVFARQPTKTYSFFSSDLTNGGRTAIPLGTGTDLNNAEGFYQTVLTTGATAEPLVGDVITDDGDPTISGVITSVSGTNPNVTIQYYLIGDPLTNFSDGANPFTASPSGFTSTNVVTPTEVNSLSLDTANTFTITHAATLAYDVNEDETNESYSILIDVANNTLLNAYQWAQFIMRRGSVDVDHTDGQEGQFYLGIDYVLTYTGSVNGSLAEGQEVTQETSGATGTIVGLDTTNRIITLRSSRGTFGTGATNHTLEQVGTPANNVEIDGTATAVAPNVAAPFGTFAGGTWFLARGVVLTNVLAANAQNFITTTNDGVTVNPPNKQAITIANTRDEDRVAVFELTTAGGVIDKGQYVSAVAAAGDTTLGVTTGTKTAIATDTPGKTTGGVLRVVDDDGDTEYRIKFASWTGTTFTLGNTALTPEGGTTTTNINDTGAFTTANIGDLVYNATRTAYSYIVAVPDANNATISPAIASQISTDTITLNVVPVALTTSDTVYVPLLDTYETAGTDASTGSVSDTITYSSDIPVLVITRNSNNTASATTPMLPYSAAATFGATGLTNNVIRTKDSIKN
jgi:hypothetical protein